MQLPPVKLSVAMQLATAILAGSKLKTAIDSANPHMKTVKIRIVFKIRADRATKEHVLSIVALHPQLKIHPLHRKSLRRAKRQKKKKQTQYSKQ